MHIGCTKPRHIPVWSDLPRRSRTAGNIRTQTGTIRNSLVNLGRPPVDRRGVADDALADEGPSGVWLRAAIALAAVAVVLAVVLGMVVTDVHGRAAGVSDEMDVERVRQYGHVDHLESR